MDEKEVERWLKMLEHDIAKVTDQIERDRQTMQLEHVFREYQGEDRLISSLELVEQMKSQPEETKFLSGYRGIDDILGGFRKKQLVVVSAATGSGKTSFCVDLTAKMPETNPVWLPFEESATELIQKFLDRGEKPPMFYTPEKMTGDTLAWVEKRIIEGKVKYNSSVFFIDHLHFIVPFSSERQDLRIGETMRKLKALAKKWNVIIFIIAHLKKTRAEEQPDIESLRDSSFVAQEADTVIMLWREAKKVAGQLVITNNVNVSIQKNRRTGKTGNVKFVFYNGRFLEQDWQHQEDEAFNKFMSDL